MSIKRMIQLVETRSGEPMRVITGGFRTSREIRCTSR